MKRRQYLLGGGAAIVIGASVAGCVSDDGDDEPSGNQSSGDGEPSSEYSAGDNEPAPNPTVESDTSQNTLNFTITGGDEFDPSVTTINAEITVNDSKTVELSDHPINEANSAFGSVSGSSADVSYNPDITGDVNAGDEFSFDLESDADAIEEWDVEVIYNPSDQDATVIYADSS